jgi:Lon protease-like protein
MKIGNCSYGCAKDMPSVIPVFPLPAALLLPRADMPLNIFEPRYIAMIDDAVASDRIIGMLQPDDTTAPCSRGPALRQIGCAGRIVSFAETGDGRYLVTLTGIARFRVLGEVASDRPYRRCRISVDPFLCDFQPDEHCVDRAAVLRAFRAYLVAHDLDADWESIGRTSSEALVNALSMIAPFAPAEKQALLEAPDLKARAETLVAIAEMSLSGTADGRRLQ